MWTFAKDVSILIWRGVKKATPPKHGDIQGEHHWRWAIFLLMIAQIIFMLLITLAVVNAYGVVDSGKGFARASDVADFREEYLQDKIIATEEMILETFRKQCEAASVENSAAVEFSYKRVERLRREYRNLTGEWYILPTCRQVGVPVDL